MLRIDSPDGLFHEPVPETETPGTRVTDKWLNAVQEELLSVLKLANMKPDPNDNSQLLKAIQYYFSNGIPNIKVDLINNQSIPRPIGVNLEKEKLEFCLLHGVAERMGNQTVTQDPFELLCYKNKSGAWISHFKPFSPEKSLKDLSFSVSVSSSGELQYTSTRYDEPYQGRLYLSWAKRERAN